MWFHLSVAKYSHSGTSKPGHEGLLGLHVTETVSDEALTLGHKERGSSCSPPYLMSSLLKDWPWLAGKGNGHLQGQEVQCALKAHFFPQ